MSLHLCAKLSTMLGTGIWGPIMPGAFIARTQEKQGEVIEGHRNKTMPTNTHNNYL